MRPSKSKTFITWIDEVGIQELAEKLGIDPSTISHWRRGHCWPRVEQMRQIRKISKGRITYEDIIDAPQIVGGAR